MKYDFEEWRSKQEGILRKPNLLALVQLSDSTIWREERAGKFPKRIRLGAKAVGWLKSEVDEWLRQRMAERQ